MTEQTYTATATAGRDGLGEINDGIVAFDTACPYARARGDVDLKLVVLG